MLKQQEASLQINPELTQKARIAIVRTDYHKDLLDNMEAYCREALLSNGVEASHITTFVAPGSWEVPLIAQAAAKSGNFDAIIAFGIIVKGQTYHFDMIANECARALMQISLDYSMPVALEILAVFDIAHAQERAGKDAKNKGTEGAIAVLKTLQVLQEAKQ